MGVEQRWFSDEAAGDDPSAGIRDRDGVLLKIGDVVSDRYYWEGSQPELSQDLIITGIRRDRYIEAVRRKDVEDDFPAETDVRLYLGKELLLLYRPEILEYE